MSRIEELIAELVPDGVQSRSIGDIADVGTGSSDRKDASDDGVFPFYVRSRDVMRIDSYEFDEEAILIPGEGDIGEIFHFVSGKYALHQRAYRISFRTPDIDTKYAYYYFSVHFKKFILQKAVSATVVSIRKPMITDFQILVPPLEIQREIVRVLDHFAGAGSGLIETLEAELEARRSQYRYYRDLLLTPKSDCEWLTLREVASEFGRGKSKHRPRNDPRLYDGPYPFIQTGDVRNSGHRITAYSQTLSDEGLAQSKLWPRGTICITIAANIAETGVLDFDACFPDSVIGMVVNSERASAGYVEYLLQSLRSKLVAKGKGSAQANINLATFEEVRFPFPSLNEQERIAAVLDRFDMLVSNISDGLPAEISARRKQYEYYRDRLLTFEEAVA
ncbi:restriction endonuclease subunit S [Okibacterium fritillariae]|uniref:Type I restriction enzyme, S subunit n=1 Tax=Okibacterium fritillariae TaxID=123320 RepID=A0A1T5JG55_9MICO|nr:restriction endonuclease subunit S [Okibacterium fritillariae]SKC50430.1 type I restriction enzyme, S subunit [Okibacterium fritillariae]